MTFEYLQRVVVDGELDVENIGQCVIQANNDLGEEFYLIIKTVMGWSEILEYGPCLPDMELLSANYNISYSRIEYNQGKLERVIDKFLNNPKRMITQAKVVDIQDIFEFLVNPIDKISLEESWIDEQ